MARYRHSDSYYTSEPEYDYSACPAPFMENHSILFLDIDGVLNNARYAEMMYEYDGNAYGLPGNTVKDTLFFPPSVELVSRYASATRSIIVICSTWRHGCSVKQLHDMFKPYGWSLRIIGKTGSIPNPKATRADECQNWLDGHDLPGYTGKFMIFDDDDDGFTEKFGELRYIRPTIPHGFRKTDFKEAMKKFKEQGKLMRRDAKKETCNA